MVNFVLSQFNTNVALSVAGESEYYIPVHDLSFDATGVIYVKTSVMKNVFKYATNCNNINDSSNSDILYYVYSANFENPLDLNPAHAMMDVTGISENAILLEDSLGEKLPSNKMLIKHDFLRYISLKLFNTGYGVDLFDNEIEMSQNMSLMGGVSYSSCAGYQILNSLYSLDVSGVNPNGVNENLVQDSNGLWCMTDTDTSEKNICREIFYQLGQIDKNRILNNVQDTTLPQSIPFEDGDTIMFTMNINAAKNQESLTNLSDVIPARSYLIKMVMIQDDSLLGNTPVVDDKTVSYELVSVNLSSGATATSDASTNTFDFTGNTNRDILFTEPEPEPESNIVPVIKINPTKRQSLFDILEEYVSDIIGPKSTTTDTFGGFGTVEDTTDQANFSMVGAENIQSTNTRDITESYTTSFSLDADLLVNYIIIGGGGGGGGGVYGSSLYSCGGAGGGGGQIVSGKSFLKANETYYITIGAGGNGGTGGNTEGSAGSDGYYSSFIDVSALGGIGGQGGKNLTTKTKLIGGLGFIYDSSIVGTGGYGVNGNATHDVDTRIGQSGVLVEYSSGSTSYVSAGGAGGASSEGYASATNSLGGNEIGGNGAVGGENGVAGSAGIQNTGSGGGGGGASSDNTNISYIDGYAGGSGRVIVWCDKYIVTDTLYNTNLYVTDLSSTTLSVKYSNYFSPAIKFNTSWVPETTGSYCSSTTSDYVEIHGLSPNTEYSIYGMVETQLGNSLSVFKIHSTPPEKPIITAVGGVNQIAVYFGDELDCDKNSYSVVWKPNTSDSYSYIVDCSYVVIVGLDTYADYSVYGLVTTNGTTSPVSETVLVTTQTSIDTFANVSYTATTAEFAWDGSFSNITIVWSADSTFNTLLGSKTDMYGNTGTITGLKGDRITYFKALSYSDEGVMGVESNVVSFRTLPIVTAFSATLYTLSSIAINWDGSFSSIKADWGDTSDFSGDYQSLSGITGNYMVAENLSIGVLYYFRVTPTNADGVVGSVSTIVPMSTSYMPTITSLVTNVLSTSSASITWDGSYSVVNILISTDSLFSSTFYSVSSLDANTKTITGMTAGTKYYIKITPHGTGFLGPISTIATIDTIPQLTGYSVTSYDSSSVLVGWTGSCLNGTIVWNTSGTFSTSDSSMNGISGVSSSQIISGLTSNQLYYVKMIPYTTSNVIGTFLIGGTTTTFKTLSATTRPIINTFATSAITTTTTLLTWSGVLANVDIYWDVSGTFTGSANLSAITGTTRTITGLLPNTKYYFKIIPKSSAAEYGLPSSILNITTLPIINTFTSAAVDTSAISVAFSGSYSTADIYWNTTNDFSTTYSSKTGITSSPSVISGLSPNMLYYFKITPYSSVIAAGPTNLTNCITKPYISSFGVSITDSSTAVLTWDGSLNTADILWNNTSSTFGSTSNRLYSVSGLTKTIVGLDSSSTYYFLLVPYNASSVVGVSSETVSKTTYYYPLITSSAVSATDSSSVAITFGGLYSHANITWNTTNVITDVSLSVSNKTSSPVTIPGLLSNVKYYFTITPYYTLPSSLVIKGSTLKLGSSSSTINAATPVLISSNSYFSFTTSNYTNATVSGSIGNYEYTNGTYIVSYSSQLTATSFAAVNAFNLYNSSLNWAAASGTYNSSGVYTGATSTFSSSISISGEYIGIQLPYGLVVKDYNIARITSNPTYNVTSYALVGSVDGINWKTLDKQTLPAVDVSYSFTIASNENSYNYYRFIAIAGSSGNTATTAGIRQLKLNGYTRTLSISGVVNTTTLAKITDFTATARNSSSATILYDGSYSTINVLRNTTGIFNTSLYDIATAVVDNPYTVTGLLSNTKYYFTLTPVSSSGISGSNSSILNITTSSIISSFSATPDTSSSLQVSWDGSFSKVDIYRNITNSPSVFDGSSVGLTGKTLALTGLLPNTTYYFYLKSYNSVNALNDAITTYATTLPILTGSSVYVIDSLSVKVSWTGNYDNVSVLYGTDQTFSTTSGSITGIQDTSATIIGLVPQTKYYFKLISYNVQSNMGTVLTDLSVTTFTYPIVSSFIPAPVDTSSISLAFDGSYSDVYIQWNTSNLFTELDDNVSYLTGTSYTLTQLQSNKTYYIGITPFFNTENGRFGSTPIVTYDVSTVIVGMTPIPIADASYATFSSNVLTVSGNKSYANGNYAVSSSSQFNTTIWNAYSAFNFNSSYSWISKNGTYDIANGGNYIGTVSTVLVSGTSILGEWIQIQMPYYSTAKTYIVDAISSTNNLNCSVFSLVGSVDGLAWYLLDSQTRTTPSDNYIGDISSNTESYRYYRLIAITGDPTALINATGINGLFINGYYATRTQTSVISTTTYPKLTSYSVSSVYDTTAVLSWDGSLSSIKVEWNYTGDFSGTNSSVSGLTGNTATITGLLPSSTVYMRIIPYSSSSLIGDYSEVFNIYTLSSISSSVASINLSNIYSIDLSFSGVYNTAIIQRNTIASFTDDNIIASDVSLNTYTTTDLQPNTTYYFRITSYNATSIAGSYSDCSITTFPIITTATISSKTSSSASFSFDGSYSSVSIIWDTNPLFTTSGNTVSGITGNIGTVSGLSSNKLYYFKLVPSNGVVSGNNSSVLTTTTNSKITSVVATPVDVSSISLTWDGSYSSVSVQWDTSSGFVTSDNSLNELSTSSATITGLVTNTTYYFRILSYSSTSEFGGYSNTSTAVTYPDVSTFGGTSASSSTVNLYWTGSLTTANILRNTTGAFSPFVGDTTSNISGLSTTISGLLANMNYYFLLRPYSSGGSLGVSSEIIQIQTKPAITTITTTAIDVSSIYVAWDGSFSSVDLLWNTTGTFRVSDASMSGLTVNNKTISGLLAGTKYYFIVVPKTTADVSGNDSSISSMTTIAEASITTTTGTILGVSSAYITWTGLYDTVNIQWSTDQTFTTIEGRANGLITNNYTINYLDENTLYYYRIIPYYGISARRVNTVYSFTTDYSPSITSFVVSSSDISSATLDWDGSFSTVNLRWNTTNIFDVSDNVITDITAESVPYTILNLNTADIYYFRITAYNILADLSANSGIINAVIGYDTSYSFASADVSATVDLIWNVDNSTDISYATISSKTDINSLDISSTINNYYIRVNTDYIIPYYTPAITDSSSAVIDNSSVFITWDGSFTGVDIIWSSVDSSFAIIDGSVNSITGVSTTISGLTGSTTYYYKVIPKIFNIFDSSTDISVNSFDTYYTPAITDFSATMLDISSIGLTWDGSYSAVDIYYNLNDVFDISDTIISGITENTYTITDLNINTRYYFRLKLYGETGYVYEYTDSSSVSSLTDYIPFITSSNAVAIDISTITVEYDGSFAMVDILWNSDNTDIYNTVSGIIDTAYTFSDLSSNIEYYFKVKPYNSTGYNGLDGNIVSSTTSYIPEIYTSSLTVLTDTSIRIEWTGVFSVVDIELSLDENFTTVSNTYLDISGSPYLISGLLPNTAYYYKITPYYIGEV